LLLIALSNHRGDSSPVVWDSARGLLREQRRS